MIALAVYRAAMVVAVLLGLLVIILLCYSFALFVLLFLYGSMGITRGRMILAELLKPPTGGAHG